MAGGQTNQHTHWKKCDRDQGWLHHGTTATQTTADADAGKTMATSSGGTTATAENAKAGGTMANKGIFDAGDSANCGKILDSKLPALQGRAMDNSDAEGGSAPPERMML